MKQSLLRQTAVLSGANLSVRALGFAMRIWLSRVMGAEAMGVLELASSAHMLWLAPVTSGIPMAVARETAAGEEAALRAGRKLSLRISLLMLPALLIASPLIARLLGDIRTLPALLCYLPCLPILALSAAYNGYCYGAGDTMPPAASEILEQCVRFGGCAALLMGIPFLTVPWMAAVPPVATFAGEAAGLLLVIGMLKRGNVVLRGTAPRALQTKLRRLAAPLTWMRVTNTLMRTVNAVLIPLRLRVSGLSAQEATARLGMFSGMAMPLVMLPGVFTGALAMVAAPAITRRENDPRAMRRLLLRVLPGALAVSLLASAGLWLGAPFIAARVYRQPDLVQVLRALSPLVPVMGLQQVVSGMLAGLGKQRSALVASLSGALLTLMLNYFLTSHYRLFGCAAALFAGHGVTLAMNLRVLLLCSRRGDFRAEAGEHALV